MKYSIIISLILCILSFVSCQEQHQQHQHQQQSTLTRSQIWGFGILAGIGISLIGFLAALILLIAKKYCNQIIFINIIKFLFALAFGALIGDALVHILAQVYANSDINGNIASAIFILSILVFIAIDRILHAYGFSHRHWIDDGGSCHNQEQNKKQHKQGQQQQYNNNKQGKNKLQNNNNNKHHKHHHHEHGANQKCITLKQNIQDNQIIQNNNNNINSIKIFPLDSNNDDNIINNGSLKQLQSKQSQKQLKQQQNQSKKPQSSKFSFKNCFKSYKNKQTTGYMNLIGSLIHNFIDGLALGVVFATGNPTQIVPTIIAIFAHQIPRQLGDVVILLKSQFSQLQTIICNGTINLLSLLGVIIGLAAQGLNQIVQLYIMVCVAGNFIYIAADIWRNLFKNTGENRKLMNGIEVIGAAVGIGAMFGIKFIENHQH